jgi:hypothetical protein
MLPFTLKGKKPVEQNSVDVREKSSLSRAKAAIRIERHNPVRARCWRSFSLRLSVFRSLREAHKKTQQITFPVLDILGRFPDHMTAYEASNMLREPAKEFREIPGHNESVMADDVPVRRFGVWVCHHLSWGTVRPSSQYLKRK